MKNIAVILAAGESKRMKGINKIFYKINGKPLILHTILIFERNSLIKNILLVTKKDHFQKFSALIKKYNLKKIVNIVEGGKERQDSVQNSLKALNGFAKKGDLILFHNGANPLVLKKEINQALKAAKDFGASLLAQPARDTIKKADHNGLVLRTIPRNNIYLAQTPQIIEYSLAKKAFERALKEGFYSTDDVSLVERLGKKVKIVPCSSKNIKITTREDLKIIENFL